MRSTSHEAPFRPSTDKNMHTAPIKSVSEITRNNRINLPSKAGVYAFWWIGEKKVLLNGNRHIVLKGPGENPVDVYYRDWWPPELEYPCLYVGKSTNIKKRFSLHLKRGSSKRLHSISEGNEKQKPVTTSCQLRFGIEHVFPNHDAPLSIINDNVGFSFSTDFGDDAIAERFFKENQLIGAWRPWFNIDSER